MAVDPRVLANLTVDRPVTLVSGTNGKTTTTRLIAETLGSQRSVAATRGANMPAGLVAAARSQCDELVLEVDELYVPRVLAETRATVLVLLNISRDQLDRISEIRRIAEAWRSAIAGADWQLTVVANADDPLVVWAVGGHRDVVWIAAGDRWRQDGALCPQCSTVQTGGRSGAAWRCECGFALPEAQWTFSSTELHGPGLDIPFHPLLPGGVNIANAATAVAVAVARGLNAAIAAAAVVRVGSVAGRYVVTQIGDRPARLLLAKNPASWTETLHMLEGGVSPVVICVNARGADGKDTSWLWDVPFEHLAGRCVAATGDRRWDLSLRLETAGVEHKVTEDPIAAVATLPRSSAPIEVVATYTAFHDLLDRLGVSW
ncbi:MAG: MurT ligase domain-containing protein [Ilumatobacteraceae bacterium]